MGVQKQELDRLVAEICALPTFYDVRSTLAKRLGVDDLVTPEVAARFLADRTFARTLLATRHVVEWRDRMLKDPLNAEFTVPLFKEAERDERSPESVGALALKAANAYIKWSESGFQTVGDAVLERRRAACLACDRLRAAPQTLAYRLADKLAGGDGRVCVECGCLFAKKISIPKETCPLASAENPRESRWGDPLS